MRKASAGPTIFARSHLAIRRGDHLPVPRSSPRGNRRVFPRCPPICSPDYPNRKGPALERAQLSLGLGSPWLAKCLHQGGSHGVLLCLGIVLTGTQTQTFRAHPRRHNGQTTRQCLQDLEARAAADPQRHGHDATPSQEWAHVRHIGMQLDVGQSANALCQGSGRIAAYHH